MDHQHSKEKLAMAEMLGYLACANNTPMEACKKAEGCDELKTAFWNGWNMAYDSLPL
jgi:hypothetical protein